MPKTLKAIGWVDPEDYLNLHSIVQEGKPIDYYGYRFEVSGGSETSGGSSRVSIVVFELLNANMAVGLHLPDQFAQHNEFTLSFISKENPTNELPVECKLSNEIKRANYDGDELEQLEYIGFSLEKFYFERGATFYLYDLKGVSSPQG